MVKMYGMQRCETLIATQYGVISYLRWLELEKERIEKDHARKAEIITKAGFAMLVVNETKGCECSFCQRLYPRKKVEGRIKLK